MNRPARFLPLFLAAGLLSGVSACTDQGTRDSQSGATIVTDVSGDIAQVETIRAVIDHIEGDELTLHVLHPLRSWDRRTVLLTDTKIRATLLPPGPTGTRRRACVTAISGSEGNAVLVKPWSAYPHPGCLAELADVQGRTGLPAGRISINTRAIIKLNGDLTVQTK